MPRKAAPWYRHSRSMWYLTHKGQQIPLNVSGAENEKAAQDAAQVYLSRTDGPPLGEAVAQFLARIKHRVKPETLRSYRWFLERLMAQTGPETPLTSLTSHGVERSAVRSTWSDSTRHDYLGAVGTFLRDSGHPLKLRRPPQTSRGVDAVWTDREFWQVYGAANGDLKPMLVVMKDTGARPAEVAGLTVDGVDWENACAVLKVHKNARKGKTRVIHFATNVMAILEEQRRQYGEGHLFRTETDRPFKPNTLHVRVRRTCERAGIERGLTLYGLRHWYCTRALAKGNSADLVAALVGNSAQVLRKSYSHIGQDAALLKGIAERVAG